VTAIEKAKREDSVPGLQQESLTQRIILRNSNCKARTENTVMGEQCKIGKIEGLFREIRVGNGNTKYIRMGLK